MAKLLGKPGAAASSGSTASDERRADLRMAARYFPPPNIFRKLIRRGKDDSGRETVTMSLQAFHKMMECALAGVFDEAAYLRKHGDIRAAVRAGTLPSALRHYATDGYFEGRLPIAYHVDETWYVATYPDVAAAIASGKVRDAADHFELFGYYEGRVPNKDFQRAVGEWRDLEKKASAES